jgi:hypothetical protein
VTFIDVSALNLSATRVESYDLQLDYMRELKGWGNLYGSAVFTRMKEFERQITSATAPFDSVGYFDGPLLWRGSVSLRWERGPWTAGWSMQYFDSYSIENASPSLIGQNALRVANQGSASVPSQVYHDALVSYRLGATSAWWNNIVVTLGVQNVFNTSPPIIAGSNIFTFGPGDYSTYGDPRLRRYTFSIRKTFGH